MMVTTKIPSQKMETRKKTMDNLICVPTPTVTFFTGIVLGGLLVLGFAIFMDYRKRNPPKRR